MDVPEDIDKIETVMAAEWVVSLDEALKEVLESSVSGRTKAKVKHVCESVMGEWLKGRDLSVLNV